MKRLKTLLQFSLVVLVNFSIAYAADRDSTSRFQQQKVLIIPYEPKMHLSDADIDIADYSDQTPQQIRAMFRAGIAEKLNTSLSNGFQTHSLIGDLRPEANEDLNRIYSAIDYSFDTSFAILHPKYDSISTGKWSEKKAKKVELEKRIKNGDVKFTNVKILDPNLISSLHAEYSADLFVFLTQIDISTKAKDCMDFQAGNFQREYKINYAVFDSNARQVYGDVVVVQSSSNTKEAGKIVSENFPVLADKIKSGISTH